MTILSIQQRIEQLEKQKANLEATLAKGGEYVSDGYECVVFEHFQDSEIANLKSQIEETQTLLVEFYKLEEYRQNNFSTNQSKFNLCLK